MGTIYGNVILTDNEVVLPLNQKLQDYIEEFGITPQKLGVSLKGDDPMSYFQKEGNNWVIKISRNLEAESEFENDPDYTFPSWMYYGSGLTYVSNELQELIKKAELYGLGFRPEDFSSRMRMRQEPNKKHYKLEFGFAYKSEDPYLKKVHMTVLDGQRCVVNIMKLSFVNHYAFQRMHMPNSFFGTEEFVKRYMEAYNACKTHIQENVPELVSAKANFLGGTQDTYHASSEHFPLQNKSNTRIWKDYKKLCLPDIEI